MSKTLEQVQAAMEENDTVVHEFVCRVLTQLGEMDTQYGEVAAEWTAHRLASAVLSHFVEATYAARPDKSPEEIASHSDALKKMLCTLIGVALIGGQVDNNPDGERKALDGYVVTIEGGPGGTVREQFNPDGTGGEPAKVAS